MAQASLPYLCPPRRLEAPWARAETSPSSLFPPQGGPVEILPYLYLGSCSHSSDLQGLRACGITAVLNVSASCPNHFEGLLRYKSIPVEDNQMVEISAWFPEAIGFIGKRRATAPGLWGLQGRRPGTCLLLCPPPRHRLTSLLPSPHFPYRLSEEQWGSRAGALPGRHLALRHHLPGIPDTESPCAAG